MEALIPVAARSTAWVCGRSLLGTAGSNPTWRMYVCLLWVLCVVRQKYLRQADHSPRGILPTVVCLRVIVKPRQRGGSGPLWGGGGLSRHERKKLHGSTEENHKTVQAHAMAKKVSLSYTGGLGSIRVQSMEDLWWTKKQQDRFFYSDSHRDKHKTWILCLWFRASLIYTNNCPTRCNTKQSIYYSASSLYMFRVSTTPIVRSTQNCNYSHRYWSYFCAATSLQRGRNGGRWLHKNMTSTGGCSYSFVYSWWWVWLTPETCRENSQNNK